MLLAAVVLPRRRADEVRTLLPRDSTIAFTALSAMAVAGSVMVLRVAPDPNPDGSVPPTTTGEPEAPPAPVTPGPDNPPGEKAGIPLRQANRRTSSGDRRRRATRRAGAVPSGWPASDWIAGDATSP